MKKPMTGAEADNRFGQDCNTCDVECYDCILSATCSMICHKCSVRNWFQGSWGDADTPDLFLCVGCGQELKTPASRLRDAQRRREAQPIEEKIT